MTKLLALTALGLLTFNGVANAAFENRADCIDAVVAHCNTLAHPVPCTTSGTDQCEEEFAQISVGQKFKLTSKKRNNRGKAVFGKASKLRK